MLGRRPAEKEQRRTAADRQVWQSAGQLALAYTLAVRPHDTSVAEPGLCVCCELMWAECEDNVFGDGYHLQIPEITGDPTAGYTLNFTCAV